MGIPAVPTGMVEIPEIPLADEMRLPASETALVIVDMQNDFVKEGGTLVVEAAGETVRSYPRNAPKDRPPESHDEQ